MQINTKFGLNDTVWLIGYDSVREWVVCPSCEGEGKVELKDGRHSCPTCYGKRGEYKYHDKEWQVQRTLTIGEIAPKVQNIVPDDMFDNVGHYVEGATIYTCTYMAYETGIGSGSVWDEERLFATKEEAEKECKRRNREK
jgi:hypothetical protein